LKGYEKAALAFGAVAVGAITLSLLARPAAAQPAPHTMFFHIKNDPALGPVTVGKVTQIYSTITKIAGPLGFSVGLEPQCVTSWADQLSYLREFAKIPVMLNVWTSDSNYSIDVGQIVQAMEVCPVKYLRFHEVMSYYANVINTPSIQSYIRSILDFSKSYGVPLFWNEWDPGTYPAIANIIRGYEDNVLVSFGTNNTAVQAGFQALQVFKRKAASIQSWYWFILNGSQPGYEFTMPPALMGEFTLEASQAGCELVQYEPYSYFFDGNGNPIFTLPAMFAAIG
jgi:hypothetical protein